MVIWIIGLSAAGKTTLGKRVHALWQVHHPDTVLVDGDELRRIYGHDGSPAAYTMEGRRINSDRSREHCAKLASQGTNVVCCILSVFEEAREWNRANLPNYFEVFLDVPLNVLEERDPKGLYAAARRGEMDNVVGLDLPFERPANPDMVIDNSGKESDLEGVARGILQQAGVVLPETPPYPYSEMDRIENPNSYFYTSFGGTAFLSGWQESRILARAALPDFADHSEAGTKNSGSFLTDLAHSLENETGRGQAWTDTDTLLKRFEVTKKIFEDYDENLSAVDRRAFHDMEGYVTFAELMDRAYQLRGDIRHLNGLLKVIDTLVSVLHLLNQEQGARLARLISNEAEYVEALL